MAAGGTGDCAARPPDRARRRTARRWQWPVRRALPSWRPWRAGLCVCLALLLPSAVLAEPRIEAARLILPTGRYPHGVLGDRIEHGGMALQLSDGRQLRMILPESLVFEDTGPRLADLDGDGAPEVLVVESSLSRGARLAVWDTQGRRSATAFIGQPWRWLAPLGAADLDGDGRIEIAYVDRPHLVKTLRLLRYEDGALTPLASAPDVSNHRIGWTEIAGGLRLCPGTPPEMILADGDWHQVLALRLTPQGAILRRVLGPYAGPDSLAAAQRCD